MKNYLYLIATIFFFSCSNEKNKEKEQAVIIDTLAVEVVEMNLPFNDADFKKFELPFTIDTLFIQKVDTNKRISYQQVRALGVNFLKSELGDGLSYDFNNFCEIDSLKQIGKYVDYVNHLDIGMTKSCIAYRLGFIDLSNNNKLFIWGIDASSYEACPYFSGTKIIATFINSEKEVTHFTIAEISNGGDPPSTGSDLLTSKINTDGKIDLDQLSISDDIDIPGEETTHTTFQLKVEENKIVVFDSKKEVKSTEKVVQ